jgi:hypothetical protein
MLLAVCFQRSICFYYSICTKSGHDNGYLYPPWLCQLRTNLLYNYILIVRVCVVAPPLSVASIFLHCCTSWKDVRGLFFLEYTIFTCIRIQLHISSPEHWFGVFLDNGIECSQPTSRRWRPVTPTQDQQIKLKEPQAAIQTPKRSWVDSEK